MWSSPIQTAYATEHDGATVSAQGWSFNVQAPESLTRLRIGLFLLGFALYLSTAAPGITWYDTGELASGAYGLGNGHPPGQPLFALLGQCSRFLPLGALPFRQTLFSALCAALCLPLCLELLLQWRRSIAPPRPERLPAWMCVALLGLAGLLPVWLQAVRVEVYALHLSGVLLLLVLAQKLQADAGKRLVQPKLVLAGGFLAGLLLGNHHLLVVLTLPGLGLLLLAPLRRLEWRPALRLVLLTVTAGLMGLTVYLYAPLRSQADALLDWGRPQHLDSFIHLVTARAYQKSFVHLQLHHLTENLSQHVALFEGLVGAPTLFLALLGLIRLRRAALLMGAVLLLVGGNAVATVAQTAFFPDNPDALGYLALGFVLLGLLSILGAEGLLDWLKVQLDKSVERHRARHPHKPPPRTPAWTMGFMRLTVALTLLLTPGLKAWPRPNLAAQWSQERFGKRLLSALPPGATWISSADGTTFAAWYQQLIHQHRPDISVVSAFTLPDDGVMQIFRRTSSHEAAAQAVTLPPASPAQKLPNMPLEGLSALTQRLEHDLRENGGRRVVMTGLDLPLLRPTRVRLNPIGLEWVEESDPRPPDAGLDEVLKFWRTEQQALTTATGWLEDRQGRLIYPSPLEALGDHLLELGLYSEALTVYRLVETFDPDPTRLVRLKRATVATHLKTLQAKVDSATAVLESLVEIPESEQLRRSHEAELPLLTLLDASLNGGDRALVESASILAHRVTFSYEPGRLETSVAVEGVLSTYSYWRAGRTQEAQERLLDLLRPVYWETPPGRRAKPGAAAALEMGLARLHFLLPDDEAIEILRYFIKEQRASSLLEPLGLRLLMTGATGPARQVLEEGLALEAAMRQLNHPPSAEGAARLRIALGWSRVVDGRLLEALPLTQEAARLAQVSPEVLRLSSYLHRQGLR